MKVLVDHNLSRKIRRFLPRHLVRTADQEGCANLLNGDLLRIAEMRGFEVLITGDQNISYQQNNLERKIALVVLTALKWSLLEPHGDAIRTAIERTFPGSYEVVPIPLPNKPQWSPQDANN